MSDEQQQSFFDIHYMGCEHLDAIYQATDWLLRNYPQLMQNNLITSIYVVPQDKLPHAYGLFMSAIPNRDGVPQQRVIIAHRAEKSILHYVGTIAHEMTHAKQWEHYGILLGLLGEHHCEMEAYATGWRCQKDYCADYGLQFGLTEEDKGALLLLKRGYVPGNAPLSVVLEVLAPPPSPPVSVPPETT
jgi:hypothetical protein